MSSSASSFARLFTGNLRLSAIVCVVVVASLVAYAAIAGKQVMWELAAYLAIGMVLSSLLNAWSDARRDRNAPQP